MGEPEVVLWDIGGVLLSNGWEDGFREKAATMFGFDLPEFERRHDREFDPLERGAINLEQYLDRTLFYEPRPFPRTEVRAFIENCSSAHPQVVDLGHRIAATGRYLSACLNNEGRDLNELRIRRFRLGEFISAFFSSCYTGIRKPEVGAYRLVLDVLARRPESIVFIDDRRENLEPAAALGMRTIHYETPDQLAAALRSAGIRW